MSESPRKRGRERYEVSDDEGSIPRSVNHNISLPDRAGCFFLIWFRWGIGRTDLFKKGSPKSPKRLFGDKEERRNE